MSSVREIKFEFDPQKNDSNKVKHGMDFNEAQHLWDDPDLLEIPVKASDEARFLIIGKVQGKHCLESLPIEIIELELFPCGVLATRRLTSMKAKQFDKVFDEGSDITELLDISRAKRCEQVQKRINVDFPLWMINSLDKEARRLGVPRQSIIKVWVAERLEKAP